MQAAGFAWIVAQAGRPTDYTAYVLPFILAGVGISMALPSVTAAGLNAVPPGLIGKAAGTLNTLQQFGAVVGIAVVTAVFNATGSLAGPAAVTHGYRAALAVAAGLSVLGAGAALGIRRARGSRQDELTTDYLPQPRPQPRAPTPLPHSVNVTTGAPLVTHASQAPFARRRDAAAQSGGDFLTRRRKFPGWALRVWPARLPLSPGRRLRSHCLRSHCLRSHCLRGPRA